MAEQRYLVIEDTTNTYTGKVVVWETNHVLFELEDGENPWGGPLRKWLPRAFFATRSTLVHKLLPE